MARSIVRNPTPLRRRVFFAKMIKMALKNDTIAVSASGGKTLATKRQSRVTNENSNNLALALEAQLGKGGLTEVTEMTFRKPAVRA